MQDFNELIKAAIQGDRGTEEMSAQTDAAPAKMKMCDCKSPEDCYCQQMQTEEETSKE
jgi:hypothetical protein